MQDNFLPEMNVSALPSSFFQYPEGTTVKCRPYSFGEVNKSNNSNMTDSQHLNSVLDGIDVVGMDKLDLTYYDVIYLALLRKRLSLGSTKATLESVCEHCSQPNTIHVNSDIFSDFEDLQIDEMPLFAELSTGELEFKFITVRDWLKLDKENKLGDPLNLLAASIVGKDLEEAYAIIYNSTGFDIEIIMEVDKSLYHGMKSVEVYCEHCFRAYKASLNPDDVNAVIRPFRSEEESPRRKISFGRKRDDKSI